nr:hypothetical protein [Tanacetum cinerariifolium]
MAFISSAKHSRGNEEVNTASVSTASTNVPTASANIGVVSISQDTACACIASQSSGKKISIQGTDVAGFNKLKVECFNCHKMGHFARECKAPRSQDRGRRDNYRQGSKVEEYAPKALMVIDEVGWDWSYMANDKENHALVADEEAPTEFALMAKTNAESEVFDNSLCSKDWLAQVKARLAEHRDRDLKYCEKIRVLEVKTESSVDCIESLKKELELIKKEKEGYNDVPPPPSQIYFPPKKDMSWTGLLEFKDDIVTNYSRSSPAIESISDDAQNRNPSEASPSTISPKPFIKFVKANDSATKSKIDKSEKAKKPPLGPNFVMKKKACFNCGDFNHLAYDCRKKVKKGTSRSQNNTHKSFTPTPAIHKPYRSPMRPMRSNMNAAWPNRTSFNKPAHSYTKRPFQRTSAVRSQYKGPRVPPVSRKFSTVNRKFSTANRKFPTGGTKFSTADMERREKLHMTGNIFYLFDNEPFDRGYVSFGQGGYKITGKGTIITGKLEFENVYFVKDL